MPALAPAQPRAKFVFFGGALLVGGQNFLADLLPTYRQPPFHIVAAPGQAYRQPPRSSPTAMEASLTTEGPATRPTKSQFLRDGVRKPPGAGSAAARSVSPLRRTHAAAVSGLHANRPLLP